MLSKEHIALLRQFVDMCKVKPEFLNMPEISFFKDFVQSLGGRIPPPSASSASDNAQESSNMEPPSPEEPEEIDEESDLEFDTTGVIESDNDPPLPMGDSDKEVTEEMSDKSDEKRTEALSAASEGNNKKALELLTEAIELNPGSALLHAKRANILLQLNKPNAAIRDCEKALVINPDSSQAYKFRGRANRLLGNWEQAHSDLATACKLDYDDQANVWLKEVEPNFKKLYEHKRKVERKAEEKEEKKRADRRRKAQEAYEKSKAHASAGCCGEDESCGGGPGMNSFAELFSDPEIMVALQDPEVMQAFSEVSQNPMNAAKYQGNPKVKKVLEKLASKMGGSGAGGGGFPGAFFKPPSASSGAQKPQPDLDVD